MKRLIRSILVLSVLSVFLCACDAVTPNNYGEERGNAFVYSQNDTIITRSYHHIGGRIIELCLPPAAFMYMVSWYPEQDETIHDEEKHELHLKKLSNKGVAYVIEGGSLYINDTLISYGRWCNPEEVKNPAPYPLMQVIDNTIQNM